MGMRMSETRSILGWKKKVKERKNNTDESEVTHNEKLGITNRKGGKNVSEERMKKEKKEKPADLCSE